MDYFGYQFMLKKLIFIAKEVMYERENQPNPDWEVLWTQFHDVLGRIPGLIATKELIIKRIKFVTLN